MDSTVRKIITIIMLIFTPVLCFMMWYGSKHNIVWMIFVPIGMLAAIVVFGVFLLPVILESRIRTQKRKGKTPELDEIDSITEEAQIQKMEQNGLGAKRTQAQMARFDYEIGHIRHKMRNASQKEFVRNIVFSSIFLIIFFSFFVLALMGIATQRKNFTITGITGVMAVPLAGILISLVMESVKDKRVKKDIYAREYPAEVISCTLLSSGSLEINNSYRKNVKKSYAVKVSVNGIESWANSKAFYNKGEQITVLFNPDKPNRCLIKQIKKSD